MQCTAEQHLLAAEDLILDVAASVRQKHYGAEFSVAVAEEARKLALANAQIELAQAINDNELAQIDLAAADAPLVTPR